MRHLLITLCIGFALLACGSRVAVADTFRIALPRDVLELFDYEIGLIKLVLQHAPGEHSFELTPVKGLTQERALELLDHGVVDIAVNTHSKLREAKFEQVNYPLTRGLIGKKVFITTQGAGQDVLSNVKSLADLRRLCIGVGSDWPVADIFEENGLCVMRAPRKQLFAMLNSNRFELIASSAKQVSHELQLAAAEGYNFTTSESLMVTYPTDFFLYVQKGDLRRKEILEAGFAKAYETGALMAYFYAHPAIQSALDIEKRASKLRIEITSSETTPVLQTMPSFMWQGY